MINNEFGIEAIVNDGLGFSDSLFNTKKSNFDGDFDSLCLEIGSTENLANFAETYRDLDAYNADQKIKMLKKLHIHTRNVPGKYGKSIENFLIEQSLEGAATEEANGKSSGANPSKLPGKEIQNEHKSFFAKIWETMKRIFEKIVSWFREKLQWLADKIGKKPNTSESIQILSSCTNEEAKDIWDELLDHDMDASQKSTDQGKVICISPQAINTFADTVASFNGVGQDLIKCAETVEKQGGYLASNSESGLSYNNIISVVADIRKKLSIYIPGGKQIPETISNVDKTSIEKFNRQFKESLSYLEWKHDPEGYTRIFTKTDLIAKKAGSNASSIAAAQYGTTNPAQLRKLIPSMTEQLATIEKTLRQLEKEVNIADTNFKKYFSAKDRNIMDNNGNLKEYNANSDSSANKEKTLSAIIVYQFASTTITCFKMVNKLIQIALGIYKQIHEEITKLTDVLDRAAKAKKNRKWFQFKKKDRDAKEANDTLKEAGLDTENEEKVDKRNANWDKLGKAGSNLKNAKDAVLRNTIGKAQEKNIQRNLGVMNEVDHSDRMVKGKSFNNSWFGKNKKDNYASSKNSTDGEYTGWEEENIPKDKKGNYKKRKNIGSNESWLLNPEDYI